MEQKIFPTWGYKDDGSEQLFDLKEGESLPDGWDAQQKPWNHPNSKHLHSRPAEPEELPKKRGPGRPPKYREEPGAEFASDSRDE